MIKLILICGISFAGKSTLGRAIVNKFGYQHVDVDEVKDQLFGSDVKDENLRHADWIRIYKQTDKLIQNYLKKGDSVIDDSRNFRKSERQKITRIATMLGAKVVTIFIDTPEIIARQRLAENSKTNSRRNVSDTDFRETLEAMEQPSTDESPLVFQNGEDIEAWISKYTYLLN